VRLVDPASGPMLARGASVHSPYRMLAGESYLIRFRRGRAAECTKPLLVLGEADQRKRGCVVARSRRAIA
jgi:hypothetical protein